MHIDLA